MTIIRWRDRLAAAWRRIYAVPYLIEILLAALILLAVICLPGCFPFDRPSDTNPPSGKPKLEAPAHPETSGERVARLEGELAKAKAIHEEDRLAPLRTTLAWVDGIAILGMMAGVGLAIAAFFFGLGFAWKIPAVIAAGFGGILAMSLTTSWALGHIGWIVGSVAIVIAGAVAWALKRHLTVIGAARQVYQQLPDSATLAPHVEALLERLDRSKA